MTQIVVKNLPNHVQVTTDSSNTFLFDYETDTAQYTNGGGAPVTLTEGTLLGIINASGKVTPLTSAAVDGSQFPAGILLNTITVAAGATVTVTYAIGGDVDVSKIIFQGADALTTVVSGRRLRERIIADTKGFRLVSSTENTKYI
jgi:hypothetical protein